MPLRSESPTLRELVALAAGLDDDAAEKQPVFVRKRAKLGEGYEPGVAEGVARLEAFRDNLALLGERYMKLSKLQARIANNFMHAGLEAIVGCDNYNANPELFMQLSGKTDLRYLTAVVMPRRFGKSTVASMYVAAVLLSVPNIAIGIFSPARRASSSLLGMIKAALESAGVRRDGRIVTENQETVVIRGTRGAGDVRTVNSYPSCVRTLKGVTANIVLMEELTQVNVEVWEEVVVPLLGVNGTSIVAITTPLGQDNYYTDLLQKIDPETEQMQWNLIQFTLVCEKCREQGISEKCSHNKSLMPQWKSGTRQKLVRSLLDDGKFLTEAMGEFGSHKHACFDPMDVDKCFLNPVQVLPKPRSPFTIYMSVDPTA